MKPVSSSDTERPLKWLTPIIVLDVGYAYHVANNRESGSTPVGRLACRQVDSFWQLAEKHTAEPEAQYLFSISANIISLANGIARNKREYRLAQEQAQLERDEMREALMSVTRRSLLWRLGVNAARAALLGGLGFALVRAVTPHLDLSDRADPNYISLAFALGFMLIGSYVQSWLNDYSRDRITLHYEHSLQYARTRYVVGSRTEYNLARLSAVRAWAAYTGSEYPGSSGYERVFNDELELLNVFYAYRQILRESGLQRIWRIVCNQRVTAPTVHQ